MKRKLILIPFLTVMLIVTLVIATGCAGDTGLKGSRGPEGSQGIQGEQGDPGLRGDIGPQGDAGIRGVGGRTGLKGTTGSVGATGEQGIQGERGLTGSGSRGATGATGPAGADGWLPPTLRDVSTYGNFQPSALVVAWQSHSYPDDTNDAGAFITAGGSIETMGVVSTELRMAYTWDFYPFNKVALLYGYNQAGAPAQLVDVKDYTPYAGPFNITYTLEIVDGGNTLVLDIVSGYVQEGPTIYWQNDVAYYTPPLDPVWVAADGQGTENTWIIGLSIDGASSTGTFSGATGEGLIHLVVQSNNYPTVLGSAKHISAYEIYLRID